MSLLVPQKFKLLHSVQETGPNSLLKTLQEGLSEGGELLNPQNPMRNTAIQRFQSGRIACLIAVILILNSICFRVLSQDILLSDFEETNYVWLPGGFWTVAGNCFGT